MGIESTCVSTRYLAICSDSLLFILLYLIKRGDDRAFETDFRVGNYKMSEKIDDQELQTSNTPGYNPGEKKSVDEYAKLDANDESLNK